MTLLIALLRLLHIVFAVIWFGLGLAAALFIVPTATAAGESGLRYMKVLLSRTRFAMAFSATAGLTMLIGILLHITGDVTHNFASTGQIVLGIGALFGLAAGIHGGAVVGRETTAFARSLAQYPDNQPIPADGLATLRAQAVKLGSDSRISFVLTVIALIAMGSARYL
jgi:hypothetical protein